MCQSLTYYKIDQLETLYYMIMIIMIIITPRTMANKRYSTDETVWLLWYLDSGIIKKFFVIIVNTNT